MAQDELKIEYFVESSMTSKPFGTGQSHFVVEYPDNKDNFKLDTISDIGYVMPRAETVARSGGTGPVYNINFWPNFMPMGRDRLHQG